MFDKRSTIEALLEGGQTLRVHVDSRKPDVQLPMAWMGLEKVPLDINPPVNKYECAEDGLHAYLGFSGMWMMCVLPWHSITLASRLGEGAIVWAAELNRPPPAPLVRPSAQSFTNGQAVGRATKYRHLRVIDGGKCRATSQAETVPPPAKEPA